MPDAVAVRYGRCRGDRLADRLAIACRAGAGLFAYGGWQQTNFIAEEIIEPQRNLPRALVLGVLVVVASTCSRTSPISVSWARPGWRPAPRQPPTRCATASDPAGATLIAAGITASTFGFLNLVIMVSPRVYQTMAADGLFFPAFARLHPRFRTPATAIVVQGVWAVVLLLTGQYGQLLDYVVFCDWIFFGLAVVSLFVLRRKDVAAGIPEPTGAFRVPGWPVTPVLFVAAALYVVAGSISSNPKNALLGSAILLLGVPVFHYWRRRNVPA